MTAKKVKRRTAWKPGTSRRGRVTQTKWRASIKPLTPREREIVSLVWKAYSNQKIAKALGISVKTVEVHRANAMKKLGVKNTVQLIRAALKKKLIRP